jgi:hypothetical protein
MEEQLIINIWDLFKEYIPAKNMDIAANHFVDFLVDNDVSTATLEGLQGLDNHLDEAIKALLREEAGYDDEGEDEEYSEDEDY